MDKSLRAYRHFSSICNACVYAKPNKIIAGYDNGEIMVWNFETAIVLQAVRAHYYRIKNIIQIDAANFVSISSDKQIKFLELKEEKLCEKYQLKTESELNTLCLLQDGSIVVGGGK